MDEYITPKKNIAETVAELTRAVSTITYIDGSPVHINPVTGEVSNLEQWMLSPRAIAAKPGFKEVLGFIEYVNKFKDYRSMLFADQANEVVSANLDYHTPEKASRVGHVATLKLQRSLAATAWIGYHRRHMSQCDFVEFLEDNLEEIVDPSHAAILQMAQNFKATNDVKFASKVNQENGSLVFSYSEDVRGLSTDGQAKMPDRFKIALPVYRGSDLAYELEARIRFRVSQNGLTLWYVIPALDRALEKAFHRVLDDIHLETGLPRPLL